MDGARALVVTGASTGIGRATTAVATARGAHVFATVRKPADAEALRAAFGAAVTPLLMDVTDPAAIAAAAEAVRARLGSGRLAGLVNNAGVAVPGPLVHLSVEDLRRQFEVNLFGLHQVTAAFAPLLGADPARTGPPGRIVMISSVAGRSAMPFLGPYAASKHALEGYSEALRRELMLFGIKVCVIAPGPVRTAIWDKAEEVDRTAFENTPYAPILDRFQARFLQQGRTGLPAEALGEVIWRRLTEPNPRLRTTILRNKLLAHDLLAILPKSWVDGLIARALGLKAPP